MIAFKYTKDGGAEYLSHLDLLRHVYRTLRRAGIHVAESCGFHAHPRIFLNNPLPVGIRSVAEYGAVDAAFTGDFKEAFNSRSPAGIKCVAFEVVNDNPNYAESIERCTFEISGINAFDPAEILREESIVLTDLRGREIDVRPRIYGLECGNKVRFVAGCGVNNLRPDLFAGYLSARFGGRAEDIVKLAAYGKGVF